MTERVSPRPLPPAAPRPACHTDYEFLMSAQARQVIEDEGIVLLSHEPARRVWASQERAR